jgi:hypothetical protein
MQLVRVEVVESPKPGLMLRHVLIQRILDPFFLSMGKSTGQSSLLSASTVNKINKGQAW